MQCIVCILYEQGVFRRRAVHTRTCSLQVIEISLLTKAIDVDLTIFPGYTT